MFIQHSAPIKNNIAFQTILQNTAHKPGLKGKAT